MLEIKTFGGLRIRVMGKPMGSMGLHKAEAILVYLAVEGKQVNRNVLKVLFWPESSEKYASKSLRVALSILRKNLSAYLVITREAVSIKPDAKVYLDLTDLETKLGSGQLEKALEIFQGDFMQGFNVHESPGFEDWLRREQERVHRSVAGALHSAIIENIIAGEYSKGLAFVQRLFELDPLDERAHQQCMRILALDHRRSAALAQYEVFRKILTDELGIMPSRETQELYQQILLGETSVSCRPIPRNNLPASQTSFIGRESELAQIRELILDPACRLLTLVGPGGSGKTRLALEAASKSLHFFPDGIYFIPLESLSSPDYITPLIAETLEFELDTIASKLNLKAQLYDHLENRTILLLMDGFEHLVSGAGLLSELLTHAPDVKVLATSRQKLDLMGEWTFPVGGLPVPQGPLDSAQHEPNAVRLFYERALQADSEFQLSSEDFKHAVHICQLVEGMPLGVELSAAWTCVLSIEEIVVEMEKGFDFLAASTHDIPDKHRSLQGAFDSSWGLLTEEQRETFSKLSVFNAGFDRQAAKQVTGVSLPQLSALLERSLLRRDGTGRFSIHALLRQFADEKLSQMADIRQKIHERHCRYYVGLLSKYEADFMGSEALQARDEIRPEMENVRAALDWASLNWNTQAVRKALVSLLCSYIVQGWHVGITALRDIAQLRREGLPADDDSARLKDEVILSAQIHQAFLHCNLGQIEESERLSRECLNALSELGFKGELSECLHNLGVNASFRGEYERARELLEEAIQIGRECNHIVWPTYLLWLGHVYFLLGEYEQGLLSLRKCYDIFERKGNIWGTAFAMSKMGLAMDGLGEHAQAMKYHNQAKEIFERASNQAGKGYSLSRLSLSAYFVGDYPQAMQFGQQGLQIFEEIGHRWGMCTSLCRLGFASLGLGDIPCARGNFTYALRLSQRDNMLPLTQYALIGLACMLALEGQEKRACELYRYVQRCPQTPVIHLQQASRWVGDAVHAAMQDEDLTEGEVSKMEPVDQVVERLLAESSE